LITTVGGHATGATEHCPLDAAGAHARERWTDAPLRLRAVAPCAALLDVDELANPYVEVRGSWGRAGGLSPPALTSTGDQEQQCRNEQGHRTVVPQCTGNDMAYRAH